MTYIWGNYLWMKEPMANNSTHDIAAATVTQEEPFTCRANETEPEAWHGMTDCKCNHQPCAN